MLFRNPSMTGEMGDRRGSILFAFPNQKTKVTNEKFGRTKKKIVCKYCDCTDKRQKKETTMTSTVPQSFAFAKHKL